MINESAFEINLKNVTCSTMDNIQMQTGKQRPQAIWRQNYNENANCQSQVLVPGVRGYSCLYLVNSRGSKVR